VKGEWNTVWWSQHAKNNLEEIQREKKKWGLKEDRRILDE